MEIHLGMDMPINTPLGKLTLEIMVEPRSSKLNTQTGQVMDTEAFEKMVTAAVSKEVKQFKYLPQTMEIYASRLWEEVEEELNYEARLSRLKLYNPSTRTFVIYDGRPEQRMARPKTKESK
jgi:hypothetical protein